MSWDPYSVLGVSKTASDDEIKSAYRKKAKALHPDTNKGDEAKAEQFKKVSAAFAVLGDKEKRKQFDSGKIDADGQPRGFAGAQGGGGFNTNNNPFSGGPGGDPFDDLLSGIFGGSRRRGRPGPRKGKDMRYRIEVSFADAVTGARRRMKMSDGRSLDVGIPPGLEDGQTLRLKSQGEASPYGGPPGDALLEVTIKPSKVWRREGQDLHMDVPVDLKTAVLGGVVDVETPSGAVSMKVPEGTNTGAVLRLRGKGVQATDTHGNLYARLMIVVEDPRSDALRKFVKSKYSK
ncbi:MAG: DnaJ C-terminal domain-containing protein [Pseudomonadota bacterium]